ncbi:hypothetical protein LBMAG56_09700 [Verrucomicrobiota bacterium]|nr:hypothetical protein LBMAG56_09700 [Verrucomicrobiota bacterium]
MLKRRRLPADVLRMSVSTTGVNGYSSNVDPRTEIGVTVLKKAQDQMKQQATALIESIDQPPPSDHAQRLDTYA